MAGEFRVDAEEQAELNRQRELKARAAAEVAALANINPDGGKYKTEPLQIAIPRKFNEVMGVVNRVLSVPVSTGLQLASMLEDPFNLDPDTPKQTELIAQVAGQGVETHLNTIKSAAVDAGIHPEHVDAAGNLFELVTLKPGIDDVLQRTKGAAFQQLTKNAPVVHAIGPDKLSIRDLYGKRPTDIKLSKDITPGYVKPEDMVYGNVKQVNLEKVVARHPGAPGNMLNPVFHHIVGKKIRWRFQKKIESLDPKGGKGRLEAIDSKYEVESGSGKDAGLPMDTGAHGPHHFDSRIKGTEPTGSTLAKLVKLMDNAKTVKEVEELYELYIKYSVIPDLDHAISYQKAYENLGKPKNIDRDLLKDTANEWRQRIKDIDEVKMDEYLRQNPWVMETKVKVESKLLDQIKAN